MRRVIPFCLLITMFSSIGARAQKDTGALAGVVKDATGAVVAGAKVTVIDADRGTSFVTSTNDLGEYVVSPLKIGRYNISVEKAGFKKAVVGSVVVDVQERPEVNVTLQIGSATETVTVTSEAVQLQTETSDLSQVVKGRTVTTLPLNGRNYAQLAQLGAGVVPAEPGSREGATFGFSANGARGLQNNFLLDGVDNNSNLADLLNETTYVIQPSVDAIAEFKVQTNAYSAEFGRGNGAILNAVIKSGTNEVHGDLYEFLRNEKLDGKNVFDQFGRQPYKQNQFGGTLGGPILKNRTFFFVDYEGLRVRQATPFLNLIPTPPEITGDFSSLIDPTFTPLTDPASTNAGNQILDCNGKPTFTGEIFNTRQTLNAAANAFAAGNSTGLCGFPIGGYDANGHPTNIFAQGLIDPLAARLAALFPPPNSNINGSNFLVDPKRQETRNNFDVRVDHKLSQGDDVFARFSYEDQPSIIPGVFSALPNPQNLLDGGGFFNGNEENSYRSVAISETHVFSPKLVNEFRLGYNRINAQRLQLNANTNVSGQLNFPGVPFSPGNGGLPSITFSDGTASIGSSTFLPSREIQNSYVLNENLTWVHGRHSMKYGTEIRREQFTIFQPAASRGTLSFGSDFTDNPGNPMAGTGGAAFATFLLGIPDGGSITNLHNVDYRRQIYSVYAQDDIRATSRLTFNVGLRYEFYTTLKESTNEQATFDFSTKSLVVPDLAKAQFPPTLAASIPVVKGSRGLIDPDLNNFAPRVGFAYKLTSKLVLRSAYGIFYGGQENGPYSNPSMAFNPPFFETEVFPTTCTSPSANLAAGQVNCANANYNQLSQGFPANSLTNPNSPQLFTLDPKLETPYNQQWHFGLQYQLPADSLLDVSYGGSRGLKLYTFFNGNQAVPVGDPQFAALCNANGFTPGTCPTAPRRPVHGVAPGSPAGATCDLLNSTDINNCDPVFDTAIFAFRSNGVSNYHSLQARFEKHFSHGLQFQASYTYSHALDDASSASLGSYASGDFRDQRFPFREYGNADFDIRHRFVINYFYELPFGKGKTFGRGASGLLNQIIGNWQVAGITSASTGNYFTPVDSATNLANSDNGGDVAGSARPNRVGDPNAKPCIAGTLFNTCAFVTNGVVGSFGNAGRNIIRGPGFQNWDLSIFKGFPINERYRFEFRAEFFNVWNHTNLRLYPNTFQFGTQATVHGLDVGVAQSGCTNGNPNQNCAFGFPQGAADPRFIQLAMKFYF